MFSRYTRKEIFFTAFFSRKPKSCEMFLLENFPIYVFWHIPKDVFKPLLGGSKIMTKKYWVVFEVFTKILFFCTLRYALRSLCVTLCVRSAFALRYALTPIRQYKLAGRLVPRGGRSDGLSTVRARLGTARARLGTARARLVTARARLGTVRARLGTVRARLG